MPGESLEKRIDARSDARNIVRNSKMRVNRPEYYGGRGAILADLNSEILEEIYLSIEKDIGKKAAKNYVQMVANIPSLSATAFLQALYALESNNWKFSEGVVSEAFGIAIPEKDKDGNYCLDETISRISVAELMFGKNRDDTEYIRGEFLMKHGVKQNLPIVIFPYN